MARLVTRAVISWLLVLGVCLGSAANVKAQPRLAEDSLSRESVRADHVGPALAGGIVGAVSAGLLLGGSVAIVLVDDFESERVTRGALLGVTALSVPSVAIMAWVTRRRAQVQGFAALSAWGWAVWTGAMFNSALQWGLVLDDRHVGPGVTIGAGAMGALGATIQAFDAFATARRAHMRFYYQIGPTAFSATLRF